MGIKLPRFFSSFFVARKIKYLNFTIFTKKDNFDSAYYILINNFEE